MSKTEFQRLREILKEKKISISEVINIVDKLPAKGKKAISSGQEMRFTVDYTKRLKTAIAEGDYGRVSRDINSRSFPTPLEMVGKKVEVVAKLFPPRGESTDEIKERMIKAGYPPATLRDFLAFGAIYKVGRFSIVALGPHKGKYFPCLDTDDEYADDIIWECPDPKDSKKSVFCLDHWWSCYRFLGIKILAVK